MKYLPAFIVACVGAVILLGSVYFEFVAWPAR